MNRRRVDGGVAVHFLPYPFQNVSLSSTPGSLSVSKVNVSAESWLSCSSMLVVLSLPFFPDVLADNGGGTGSAGESGHSLSGGVSS